MKESCIYRWLLTPSKMPRLLESKRASPKPKKNSKLKLKPKKRSKRLRLLLKPLRNLNKKLKSN